MRMFNWFKTLSSRKGWIYPMAHPSGSTIRMEDWKIVGDYDGTDIELKHEDHFTLNDGTNYGYGTLYYRIKESPRMSMYVMYHLDFENYTYKNLVNGELEDIFMIKGGENNVVIGENNVVIGESFRYMGNVGYDNNVEVDLKSNVEGGKNVSVRDVKK